ncbi:MAG: hypothetical protein ABSH50_27050 [Bryobacteraceae bacterium]|jgi:uncharacterized membrane protein HdeD (DUF308 family)
MWLLAVCGIAEAIYAATNLFMRGADGSLVLRTFVVRSTVMHLGTLALIAGVAAIAAGLWNSRGKSWLLVLNGAAFSILGLLLRYWTGPLSFRSIALLIAVMAVSAGIFEFGTGGRLLRFAGIASVIYALALLFFAFLPAIPKDAETTFVWMGSYFGFSALCMLGLAWPQRVLPVVRSAA